MEKNLEKCFTDNIKFAIISNESHFHLKTVVLLSKKKIPFILEKPLSHKINGIEKLIKIIKENHLQTLMGCNLRFHPCIMKIKNLLDDKKIGKVILAKVENSSFLPDWHPYEDYKKS